MKIKLTIQNIEISGDENGIETESSPMILSFEADDTCPMCDELLDDSGWCINTNCPESRYYGEDQDEE